MDIKAKIQSMLNLSRDAGATDGERDAAMRMAMNWMLRHGIEESQLGDGTKPVPRAQFGSTHQRGGKAMKRYQLDLMMAAAKLYGCRALTYDKKSSFQFIGRPDNIEAAEQTMLWLERQLDELFKALKPGDVPLYGAYRKSFKDAAAEQVHRRAVAMVADHESSAVASGSTALVVQGYFEQLAKENDEALSHMRVKTSSRRPLKMGQGTFAGIEAGNRIKLRREIQ